MYTAKQKEKTERWWGHAALNSSRPAPGKRRCFRPCCARLRRILLTALLGGLLGATLVRLGPGFDTDERELDNRLSAESRAAIRAEHAADSNIAAFYVRYLSGLVHGDLGFSRSLNRPVSELLKERLPLTLGSLGYGVLGGISIGLALAMLTACWRAPGSNLIPGMLAGSVLRCRPRWSRCCSCG